MNILQRIKDLLLPYENPEHPLYAAPFEEPDLSDWDDLSDAPYQIEFTVSSDPETKHRI
jgi:hypothetical protein